VTAFSTLVNEALGDDDRSLEREIFGTDDAEQIAAQIQDVIESKFSVAGEALFYRHSVGVV